MILLVSESSDQTCMEGEVLRDIESNELLYDDVRFVQCNSLSDGCYQQTIEYTHNSATSKISVTPQYNEKQRKIKYSWLLWIQDFEDELKD